MIRIDLKRMPEDRLRAVAALLHNEHYEQRGFLRVMEALRDERARSLVWVAVDFERMQGYCQALDDVCMLIAGAGEEIRKRHSTGA